jgi:NADP-dependent 3-hydroxy acid dehydrogenase YdfG
VARDGAALARVCEEVAERGGEADAFPADLTERGSIPDLVERIAGRLGQLDALVNNAGAFDFRSVADADLARWDRLLDLNLRAAIHLTRHALPHLCRRPSSAVVNVASVAGKDYVAGGAAYSASKFGLYGFGGSLFEDVRDRGVKVCTIAPGQAAARIDHAPAAPDAFVPLADIARVVAFVLEFPATSCPTEIVLRAQRSPGAGTT